MAAALLAALFAMGVFSAGTVGADSHLVDASATTDNLATLVIVADDNDASVDANDLVRHICRGC